MIFNGKKTWKWEEKVPVSQQIHVDLEEQIENPIQPTMSMERAHHKLNKNNQPKKKIMITIKETRIIN